MKKLTQWFNGLPTSRQRWVLLGFCLLFAGLLIASIAWQQTKMNFGTMTTLKTK